MASLITLATSSIISSVLWQSSQGTSLWGVYDDQNNEAISPDSFLEFGYRREYEVSDFPVQEGSFAAYNRVVRPFEVRLRVSQGGTQEDRALLLNDLETMISSTGLYTVVTPETSYSNCNADRYEITRRGAAGAYFLTEVDIYFTQIIEVSAQYTNTGTNLPDAQSPAAQPTSNVGSVQLQNPSSDLGGLGDQALASQSLTAGLF